MGERLIGTGMALPERVLDNDFFVGLNPFYHYTPDGELVSDPDEADGFKRTFLDEEGIVKRTGVERRRICAPNEYAHDLAGRAAQAALDDAGMQASDLGGIVVASLSQKAPVPSIASIVHGNVGAKPGCGAYDLGAACAGYVAAFNTASLHVRQGLGPQLVVGVETPSKWIDYESQYPDINMTLFGDGAGAAILYPSDEDVGVRAYTHGCDPSEGRDRAISADPGVRLRMADGRSVFIDATRRMAESATYLLGETGWGKEEVLLIPHQANIRIIQSVAKQADFPMERVFVNVQDYGNMSAATTAIGLHEARMGERGYEPPEKALMVGFGAGFVWAGLAFEM